MDRERLPTPQAWQRIHVIGGPGSGKTHASRYLGATLRLPVYELDRIAFAGPHFRHRPLEDRLADVHQIAMQPAWITEGMFLWWTEELFQRATQIIWLDHLTWAGAYGRILARFIHCGMAEARRQTGTRKFMRFHDYARNLIQLGHVFFTSRRYYCASGAAAYGTPYDSRSATRFATMSRLAIYRDKTIHCQNAAQLEQCIAWIRSGIGFEQGEKNESSLYPGRQTARGTIFTYTE